MEFVKTRKRTTPYTSGWTIICAMLLKRSIMHMHMHIFLSHYSLSFLHFKMALTFVILHLCHSIRVVICWLSTFPVPSFVCYNNVIKTLSLQRKLEFVPLMLFAEKALFTAPVINTLQEPFSNAPFNGCREIQWKRPVKIPFF